MRKSVSFFVILGMLLCWNPLWAATGSPEGRWKVKGKISAKAEYFGQTISVSERFTDRFVFKGDNFSMIGIKGKWRLKSGKIKVYLNTAQMEDYVEDFLRDQGFIVEVDITKSSFTLTPDYSTNTFSGKWVVNASLDLQGIKISGNLVATFNGTRLPTLTTSGLSSEEIPSSALLKGFLGMVQQVQ